MPACCSFLPVLDEGPRLLGWLRGPKFALEGLMQTLADELTSTSNIRVNSLNPGGTRTAMRQAAYPAEDPHSQPAAESLMPVYLYLLGPEAPIFMGRHWMSEISTPAY